MNIVAVALPALLLASCQALPDDTGRAPYKALGTEPFWGLTIENKSLTFTRAGEADIRVGSYEARPSFNGWRYVSRRITADVTFTRCSDGMSDNVYKDTVTVQVDGTEYKGCGGGVVK
jgi:heat shock protein HslJ